MKPKENRHPYLLLNALALIFLALFAPPAQAAGVPCNPNATCAMLFDPVCGVDGQTYPNSCIATNLYCMEVAYVGVCGQAPLCVDADQDGYSATGGNCGPVDCNDLNPSVNPGRTCYYFAYTPVCGVDGVTYFGPCEAENACMPIAYNGECVQPPTCTDKDLDGYSPDGGDCGPVDCNDTDPGVNPGMMCSAIYAPVCGSDGNTYPNSCAAAQACVAIASVGECYQPPVCTDTDLDGFAAEGGECGPIDCDDHNPSANPGATEIKNNQVDENCNGMGDDLEVLPLITKAEYSQKNKRLTINATSELGRQDALVVEGFGIMAWDRRHGRWSLTINKLSPRKAPTTVTVTGLYGSATANITRTR